jgi:hypothetical protein
VDPRVAIPHLEVVMEVVVEEEVVVVVVLEIVMMNPLTTGIIVVTYLAAYFALYLLLIPTILPLLVALRTLRKTRIATTSRVAKSTSVSSKPGVVRSTNGPPPLSLPRPKQYGISDAFLVRVHIASRESIRLYIPS